MSFITVGDYLTDARVVLQDQSQPYRYRTTSLVTALNLTIKEVRRIRPDLLEGYLDAVPSYDWSDDASTLSPGTDADQDDDDNPTWFETVPIEESFKKAIVFGITAHAMERDQEDIQDERATADLMKFENMLTEVRATKGLAAPKG